MGADKPAGMVGVRCNHRRGDPRPLAGSGSLLSLYYRVAHVGFRGLKHQGQHVSLWYSTTLSNDVVSAMTLVEGLQKQYDTPHLSHYAPGIQYEPVGIGRCRGRHGSSTAWVNWMSRAHSFPEELRGLREYARLC